MNRAIYACLLAVGLILVATSCFAQLAPSTWPKFHRDCANSGAGLYGSASSELSWSYAAPGAVQSAPIIGPDGTIYFTCDDGYLYALTGGGLKLWSANCGCLGTASPAIGADGTIYAPSSGAYLYAFAPNGTLKWRKVTSARIVSSINVASNGTLYFGCSNGNVVAADSNGNQKWAYSVGGSVTSTPAVGSDGTVYVGGNGAVYALTSSGTLKWKFIPPSGGVFSASPALGSDGTVYIGSSLGFFYAIVGSMGTQKWRAMLGSEIVSSAAVSAGGIVYFGCRDSKLYALNAANGAVLWSYGAGSSVDSSPAAASDGGVCVGTNGGSICSFTSGGAVRWTYGAGSSVVSSPAIGPNGELVVGSLGGVVYCFGADSTPPTAPSVTDDGNFACLADRLHGSWSASDAESGVYCYEYCIGTAPGLADVGGWVNVGSVTQQTRTGLALLDNHTYYLSARATNGAGLVGPVGSSDGITIDATPPGTPAVADDGAFTSDATGLHASWSSSDPQSGIARYSYSIGTTPGGTNTVGWTDVGLATSVTRAGLSLSNGVTYYINVKATNGADGVSLVGSSDGIVVDGTPPNTPTVTDDGAYFSDPHLIHARWTATDAESGITRYEYCVGTSAGGSNVVPWTNAGTATSATATGLNLTSGTTYYVGVRATNGVGLVSAAGSSDGIKLDLTAPDPPVVADDGAFTSSTTDLNANWSGSDPESGISHYRYAVGTSVGASDVVSWTNTGVATSIVLTGLALSQGTTYYVSVTAVNGAGIESTPGSSDGITVDATPPTTPVVTDDGDVQNQHDTLHASWTSSDPESGIQKYEYSIGTAPGAVDIRYWTETGTATSVTATGLDLQDGTRYYVSVRATNRAHLVSSVGSSDGILVDSTPPPAPTVTDDGAYTSSGVTLHATWTSVASANIASFDYSIGTAAGLTDVRDWTSVGLAYEVTATGLTLNTGHTYYINVRAVTLIGKPGDVGSSDGILVDMTPPTAPTVTDAGAYSSSASQLVASWTATDAESGVVSYEYAVGTASGGTDVRGWTPAGALTSMTIGSLSLADGGTYYVSVRATNGAGLKGPIGSSDGIIVDITPPSRPTVTDDGAFTTNGSQLHATWSASDAQSGISKYEYAVGTTSGGTETRGWTSAGAATDYTIAGLTLTSGVRYYISVRATNGAGLLSAVGTSDGILVDSTPPTIPVVVDDGRYTTSTTTLHATWSSIDPETGIVGYEYSIGSSAGGTDLVGWTGVGLTNSVTRTDLSLTSGITYYINVRATNGVGLTSIGSSDGITVDTTPPPAPTVTDDGVYTANTAQLHAKLECNDPESGVGFYECAVGTTPLGTDVAGWRNSGPGPDVTITGLSLVTGVTYYISARATNGASLSGPAAASDGIKADITPPVGLTVTDDGEFSGSATTLHGSWTATDPESGIAGYKYCIGTSPGSSNIANWLDAGSAIEHTRTGLSLANGQTYYITVVATNGAGGSCAPVSSDGIKTDFTPPTTPVVTDTGTFWGYKTSLWASWTSGDPESGIVEYAVSAGTTPGGTDVADWRSAGSAVSFTITGLHLSDGTTYYFNVKAKNGAKSWSAVGSSDGVMIDSTPPTTPVVIDDGDTTSVLDRLHATWHSEDPESGIAEYTYCIGTSPGATDVKGWTSAGTSEDVTVTGLSLDPVLRYYFSVKARSGAGAWSATGASDGIGYTSGAYLWARFHSDSRCTGRGLFNATQVSDLAWSIQTSGPIESSPAIAGDGTTYVGSNDGTLYAITQNGTIRWSVSLESPVNGSPAIADNGAVVVGTDDGKIHCLDRSGTVVWVYPTTGAVLSSAVIKDGVVYIGSVDRNLYALALDTGVKLWSYTAGGAIWSSPAIDGAGVIYVTSEDGCLYAINPTGTRKWKYQTGSSITASPSVGSDGVVYFGSGDGGFYAINPDGTRKWRFETYSILGSSAAIDLDGILYFGTGYEGSDGRLYALKPDGTEKWHLDLVGGGISSSPAIDPSGTIYFGACDKKLHALKSDKTLLWAYDTGDSVYSSPALGADGSVIFGSYDGKVYCLRDATSKDLTPPTTPVVTVPSASIALGDPFMASWSATDPESMVAEYTYAVGTAPGGSDVAGWTSAGIETSMARDDLFLEAGKTYYVSVNARNPSQRWSDVGVSRGVSVISAVTFGKLGEMKAASDIDGVSLYGKTVTAAFADCFFVEEIDRSCGLRCAEASTGLQPGDIVDLGGDLMTINGERVLGNATHVLAGSGDPIKPVGISEKAIVIRGCDVLGLEVTVCGSVTATDDGWFVVDDGSQLVSARSGLGLEVRCEGQPTSTGKYISAIGVLCRELVNGAPVTVLRLIPGKLIEFN